VIENSHVSNSGERQVRDGLAGADCLPAGLSMTPSPPDDRGQHPGALVRKQIEARPCKLRAHAQELAPAIRPFGQSKSAR
jgi:hypothetical protein